MVRSRASGVSNHRARGHPSRCGEDAGSVRDAQRQLDGSVPEHESEMQRRRELSCTLLQSVFNQLAVWSRVSHDHACDSRRAAERLDDRQRLGGTPCDFTCLRSAISNSLPPPLSALRWRPHPATPPARKRRNVSAPATSCGSAHRKFPTADASSPVCSGKGRA